MKKWIYRLIFFVALCVFIYSGYNLGYTYYKYWKVNKDNSDLQEKVVLKRENPLTIPDNLLGNIDIDDGLSRTIDFNSLRSVNKDIIGWIYIPNTNIDYALLKGATNDTYIHHNYKKVYSFAGSIFLEENNNGNLQDDNTIIYGHNMKNGSMFAGLKKFNSQDYMNKHPNVYIYLPDGSINVYQIFSSNGFNATSSMYSIDINYTNYVNNIYKTSRAKKDIDTVNKSPLIMLSTCTSSDSDARTILYARLSENVR